MDGKLEQRPDMAFIEGIQQFDRMQNIPKLEHVLAKRSGDVENILSILRQCEQLHLTDAQMDISVDIACSVNEHSNYTGLAAYYLVRYGMLLERSTRDG